MEPIAITGIGCKLPGGVTSPSELWAKLLAGADLVTESPPDRWSVAAHYHPTRTVPGKTYSRWGGYVNDPAGFDAAFFGLTPREAVRMDPQQRWLLECAWEAIQDAGYPLAALAGSGCGVFVGIASGDYGDIQARSRFDVDVHNSTGSAFSISANRISYLFDLRGPSMAIDTACSSALVALDLGCQAIARGDIPVALVGAANAILQPDVTIAFSKAGMLSPTGRCRAFDASADGFVRAEGAGVVVLKPLARALADGDRVYAVVRSTFTNQDGRTGGLTVPSVEQQEAMLRAAYARADVRPTEIGFVEAHGTGTAVGDPIEVTALGRALGCGRPADRPLWIGSVKSNLGHLEPASGIAGLIKLMLALHHRTIPPNVHFREPNPAIPFDQYQLRVPTSPVVWEPARADKILWGGVNSFGFGGTNAHAVLCSAPPAPARSAPSTTGPTVWTVSARSRAALEDAVRADAEFLSRQPERFAELGVVALARRTHHPHRLAVVADSAEAAAEKLRTWKPGATQPGVFDGHPAATPAVAVVFTGQGTQWPGMARDLYQSIPEFRATVEELDTLMRPSWNRSVTEDMLRGDDSVFRSDIGQGILFALQVGVYRMFHRRGLRPAVIFGHSIGEAAAAFVTGALTLPDAARVIVERAKAQELTRGSGAMAAVGLSEEEIRPLLEQHRDRLHVAAVNSPTDLTLAGDAEVVRGVVACLTEKGRFARLLPFPYAFHSPKMDMCRDSFLPAVSGIRPRATEVPYISTVTGTELAGTQLDPDYWWRNLREPVAFAPAVRRAAELGAKVFLEIGPHPGLVRYIHQTLGAEHAVIPTLKRKEDGSRCLAESTATLYAQGIALNLADGPIPHADLPRHSWARVPCWCESPDARHLRLADPVHPLLGVADVGSTKRWEKCVSTDELPYLADHGFRARAVFPGAAHLELMFAASAGGSFAEPLRLTDVNFERALWIDQPHVVQTSFDPLSRRLAVSARAVGDNAGGWELVSRGLRAAGVAPSVPEEFSPPADAQEVSVAELYTRFERAGHHYGPQFRTIRRMHLKDGVLWAKVALDSTTADDAGKYYLHPALLDGVLQSALRATPTDDERESMFLPVRVERAEWWRQAGTTVVCRVSNLHAKDLRWFADIHIFTPTGEPVMALIGCCCVKKPQEAHVARSETRLYREEWRPAPRGAASDSPPTAWLLVDPDGAAGQLSKQLVSAGAWVGHQTGSDVSIPAEFLKRANGNGGVVIWAAGTPQSATPSVGGVLQVVEPMLKTAQALAAVGAEGISLWLVTAGATFGHADSPPSDLARAAAAGMFRTVATELPKVVCRLVDLDPAAPADFVELTLAELWSNGEDEVAYRGGARFGSQLAPADPDSLPWRPVPAAQAATATYELRTTEPGSLDGLAWAAVNSPPLAAHEIEIEVRAVGLNFRDVLKALDIYPLAPTEPRSFGDECAGVVTRVGSTVTEFRPGDAVVAISAHGFGNRVRVPAVLAAKKPKNLAFEQVATIPIAFLTADYCLADVARLERGESVLIHAAAGGVGQAAVQIARRAGAEIYATASPDKHDFLRAQGVRHVFHSRNLSFAEGVRHATGGRGVDVALNSLAGEFIPRTLELLAPGGRFVEIGKKDIFQNTPLDLNPFRNSVSFAAVDLAGVIARRPEWVGRRLRALLDLFAAGELTPLAATAFAVDQVTDAFRLMAQGKHRGKLVVTPDAKKPPAKLLAHELPLVRPDASYLVTGGLSGLGLRTAEWLADRGAKWLILASRSGAKSPAARAMDDFAARGVKVEIVACDVADPDAVQRLVRPTASRLPLRGVVHSAMVLRDEVLTRVGRESLEEVLSPKIAGAWNLHLATHDLPLDWFVMYSSVATLVGSAGQASYVAANRFLDALAWHRRAVGLPAIAVNWGPLADVGVVANNAMLTRYLDSVGLGLLPPDEVFGYLKFLLRRDVTTAGVMRVDWDKFRAGSPTAGRSHRLAEVLAEKARADGADGESDTLRALLACPAPERVAFLLKHLQSALAGVLLADEATLDPTAPLTSFGVDSLMAFEFKLRIDRDFKTNVPIDKLSAGATLTDLSATLLCVLTGAPEAAPPPCTPVPTSAPAPAPVPARPADGDYQRVLTRTAAAPLLDTLTFDAAALLYLPDRLHTVGGLSDEQMAELFGTEPFISHLYETSYGRIAVVTLPIRGKEMFNSPRVPGLVRAAGTLARKRGAKVVSLTGLIPSATGYGQSVCDWFGSAGPQVTTGHATTTAAVIHNLRNMLELTGRYPGWEHLAVLGLGSIGQSCLSLLLDVLPHPRALTLCDVFAKQDEAKAIARRLKERHNYRGPLRVLTSDRGLPDGLFEATTILTAVSVPDVIDVARLRPGTIVVDDSYPPGFQLERAIERAASAGDLFFSNAGMARLPDPIRETVFLPPGAEPIVARFGDDAFRRELARDPRELTACILSSLLTLRFDEFQPTVGLADLIDLRSHYNGLVRLGITAARPQCGTHFVPDEVLNRFRDKFSAPAGASEAPGVTS